jgi:predicted AlkP superfamily phosphohydrolase/phosphomutase/tetratricopeptide (TPR) repeat protein
MTNPVSTKRILLIGWDAADWKVIHQLVDQGKMPNMAKFIEEGVIGNLATLYPELSPMLWTSIATGKRPHKHGILGFTEPDPDHGSVRPITNLSRKTKAIWNIFSQLGLKCIVTGWWPSHPVEPINGVMVSNHYQKAVAPHGQPWPMKPNTVHPKRLTRNLAELRLHPQDIDPGAILDFVPRLPEIDQEKNHRIEGLAKIIAECASINRATTAIMHHESWHFAAAYFDGIDHFCHGFMNYHPPRLSWVSEKDFGLYNKVVESGYIYHDHMLGALLEEAGSDATVMIVSDHGFHSDHLRPRHIPVEAAGPAVQHRPYGIFAIKGPGIKKDEVIYGASLLDICPTILTLAGLPVGNDMDGKPLVNIFEKPPVVASIESWDLINGNDGMHPEGTVIDPLEAQETIDLLVALGYIEKPDDDKEMATKECRRELQYNLARSYMEAGLHGEATHVLEGLFREWPNQFRFGIQLVQCYISMQLVVYAKTALDDILKRKKEYSRQVREELKKFTEEHKDIKPEDFSRKEQSDLRRMRAESSTSSCAIEYMRGEVLLSLGKTDEALGHFKKAEKESKEKPELYNRLGESFVKLKKWEDARKNYNKAIDLDPDNADSYAGLSRVALGQRKNRLAVETGLAAAGLRFHMPQVHYCLGIALGRIDRTAESIQAFEVAISQNPAYVEAHNRLAAIYKKRIYDPQKAEHHKHLATLAKEYIAKVKRGGIKDTAGMNSLFGSALTSDAIPKAPAHLEMVSAPPYNPASTVLVVSGLPRSGTSMMMQMLGAGGLAAFTDEVRQPDDNNPRGYFEHEKVKRLREEQSWLPEAKGRVVKIVAQLLPYLPRAKGLSFRVLFMDRDLDEVVSSQEVMLDRRVEKGTDLQPERLKKVFQQQLRQVKAFLSIRKIPTLFVNYGEATAAPESTVARVNAFLGGNLDEEAMVSAVDRSLHRLRRPTQESDN